MTVISEPGSTVRVVVVSPMEAVSLMQRDGRPLGPSVDDKTPIYFLAAGAAFGFTDDANRRSPISVSASQMS